MPQNIITRVVTYGLDIVQLHGHETPTLLRNLRATLTSDLRPGLRIMKAISLSDAEDLQACAQYEQCTDLFLFDTKCCNAGGSGRHFDWSLLDNYKGSLPYLLSGGIGPGDAEDINRFLATHPQCIGIDLNSRFETEPGVKDVETLRQFISQLSVQPHTQTDTTV